LGDFGAALAAIFAATPAPTGFNLLGSSERFWTGSGRQALRLFLRALKLERNSGVALPLFADPSLAAAIAAAGHRPVFLDIDPRFLTVDPDHLDPEPGHERH